MTIFAKAVDGVVVKLVVADEDYLDGFVDTSPGDWAEAPEGTGIGHLYNRETGTFSAPSLVPKAVTMRQARLALLQAGMLSTVNAAVAAMPGAAGEAARIEWEFSSEVQRNKALVLALAPVLNLSEAQLDDLFIHASTL